VTFLVWETTSEKLQLMNSSLVSLQGRLWVRYSSWFCSACFGNFHWDRPVCSMSFDLVFWCLSEVWEGIPNCWLGTDHHFHSGARLGRGG
jgi:hypothetical protein